MLGTIVNAVTLPKATVRECGASVLLALAAWHAHGIHTPTLKGGGGGGNGTSTLRLTMLCGLSVLLGQLLFLIGLKMSNPVSASVSSCSEWPNHAAGILLNNTPLGSVHTIYIYIYILGAAIDVLVPEDVDGGG